MRIAYFIVLMSLISACSLKNTQEGGFQSCGGSTASINVGIMNLPASVSPDDVEIQVVNELGVAIPMTRWSVQRPNEVGFEGTAELDHTYTGHTTIEGRVIEIPILLAGAYCDFNAWYDYLTDHSFTAI